MSILAIIWLVIAAIAITAVAVTGLAFLVIVGGIVWVLMDIAKERIGA